MNWIWIAVAALIGIGVPAALFLAGTLGRLLWREREIKQRHSFPLLHVAVRPGPQHVRGTAQTIRQAITDGTRRPVKG